MPAGRELARRIAAALIAVAALASSLGGVAPRACLAEEADLVGTPTSSLGLENGTYTIELSLKGGSGRATIESPTRLEVYDDRAYVTITWSSPNYDYMKVDGRKHLPKNGEGNSSFEIPVDTIDEPLKVIADTTAMSKPHEIAYQITFDRSSLKREFSVTDHTIPIVIAATGIVLVALVFAWSRQHARRLSEETDL